MSPESTAGIPSQSGWYSRLRRNFWRRLSGRHPSCRTRYQANQHSQEKLRRPGKGAFRKSSSGKSGPEEPSPARKPAGQGPPLGNTRYCDRESVPRRGSGLHVAPRIDGRIVHPDFVVDVRTGRAAAYARVANHFAALDARARDCRERGKVRVPGGDSESMIDNHQAAVASMVPCDGDDSIRSGGNRSAIVRSHIHSGVKRAFTAERVQALAEAIGNVTHHRPDRRRVRGVGKAHRGEQMEPAAGDGNHCGIALQESVLLDGTIESILST